MSQWTIRALALALAFAASAVEVSAASAFVESFDAGDPTWQAEYDPESVRVVGQSRQDQVRHEGQGAESFQAQVGPAGGTVLLSHPLDPAMAIEDLRLAVWTRSNQPGLRLCMRLVFPGEVDPETGGPLTVLILGDRYAVADEWQQLTCTASADAVQDAIRRTRYRLNGRGISVEGLYVDQAVVSAVVTPGSEPFEVVFDALTFGPIIPPPRTHIAAVDSPADQQVDRPVEFRLNRLEVEGEPFFPIMAPFHAEAGETVAELASTGINVAWIKDYRDDALLEALRQASLWATATPPRVETASGEVLGPHEAGIVPFGPESRAILFWNLGPRIQEIWLDQVIGWVQQLKGADAAYDRPVLADITGAEYAFSNHIDLLASSRHITNTSIPFENYRDWLKASRSEAFLNTFFWTWVQTEPASQTAKIRSAAGQLPVVIEPEQIRLQVYAALQAGCRGIGYWKTTPFGADGPGSVERRHTLTRLNAELELLEPLLATGDKPSAPVPFSVTQRKPGSDGYRVRPSYHQITMTGPKAEVSPFAPSERPPGRADAVLIETAYGPLLIAVWYGEGAQFCPGQMAKHDAKIVVPGVEETAAAWLMTPTGIRHLPDKRVAGGKEITIEKFDQTAVVLFTTDHSLIRRFHRAAAEMAPRVAEATVELAKAKRVRVGEIDDQLRSLAPPLPDGPAMLHKTDQLLATAEASLEQGSYDAARRSADDALQMLRYFQRLHWENAVRQFQSPLASPHAVCFSTLPDHYRLIAKVGRNIMTPPEDANLLPTGAFEDDARMLEEGWRHEATNSAVLTSSGALVATSPKEGRYCLELRAERKENAGTPSAAADGAVLFTSPPMPVQAGQVLHISGWVKVVRPMPDHLDGATFHESLLGPSSGLRWTKTNGWEPFQMLREVTEDGEFHLTLSLHGPGEVYFDDVRVVPHTPRQSIAEHPGRFAPR